MKKKYLLTLIISLLLIFLYSSCSVEDSHTISKPEGSKLKEIDSSLRITQMLCRNLTSVAENIDNIDVVKNLDEGKTTVVVYRVPAEEILLSDALKAENKALLDEANSLLEGSIIVGIYTTKKSIVTGTPIHQAEFYYHGKDDSTSIKFNVLNNKIVDFDYNNEKYDLEFYTSINL